MDVERRRAARAEAKAAELEKAPAVAPFVALTLVLVGLAFAAGVAVP